MPALAEPTVEAFVEPCLHPLAAKLRDLGGVIGLSAHPSFKEGELLSELNLLPAAHFIVRKGKLISLAPVVGMGVTMIGWTDREPYEVVAVAANNAWCDVRPLKATLDPTWHPDVVLGGFVGHVTNNAEQRWLLSRDRDGAVTRIRLCAKGWALHGVRYCMGIARKFHDYNF